MAGGNTRQRLIGCGRSAFLEVGYHGTGVQQILSAAGVPKGSFYHHFPSKDDFALAVLNDYAAERNAALDAVMARSDIRPIQRIELFFTDWIAEAEAGGFRSGCLVGSLSAELATGSGRLRGSLEQALAGWQERIAVTLARAQRAGHLDAGWEPDTLAGFIIDAWQGALLHMQAERRRHPLDRFVTLVFRALLAT